MKISKLIELLRKAQALEGDLEIRVSDSFGSTLGQPIVTTGMTQKGTRIYEYFYFREAFDD